MDDTTQRQSQDQPFRQDHDTMRAASMQPVSGPASIDTLAAAGGLEVPGREAHPPDAPAAAPVPEPIPGQRDPNTLTHRQPGAVGGQFSGGDTPSPGKWMDDHAREGGKA